MVQQGQGKADFFNTGLIYKNKNIEYNYVILENLIDVVEDAFNGVVDFFKNIETEDAFKTFKPPEDRRYMIWYYKARY